MYSQYFLAEKNKRLCFLVDIVELSQQKPILQLNLLKSMKKLWENLTNVRLWSAVYWEYVIIQLYKK